MASDFALAADAVLDAVRRLLRASDDAGEVLRRNRPSDLEARWGTEPALQGFGRAHGQLMDQLAATLARSRADIGELGRRARQGVDQIREMTAGGAARLGGVMAGGRR